MRFSALKAQLLDQRIGHGKPAKLRLLLDWTGCHFHQSLT